MESDDELSLWVYPILPAETSENTWKDTKLIPYCGEQIPSKYQNCSKDPRKHEGNREMNEKKPQINSPSEKTATKVSIDTLCPASADLNSRSEEAECLPTSTACPWQWGQFHTLKQWAWCWGQKEQHCLGDWEHQENGNKAAQKEISWKEVIC